MIQAAFKESDATDEGWQFQKKEILAIFEAFEDTPRNAEAHRAVAELLQHSEHPKIAWKHIHLAMKLASEQSLTVRIKFLAAQIRVSLRTSDEACDLVMDALKSAYKMPPRMLRQYLITRARAKTGAQKLDLAVQSYEEARKADPQENMPGYLLREAFDVIMKRKDPFEVVGVLR